MPLGIGCAQLQVNDDVHNCQRSACFCVAMAPLEHPLEDAVRAVLVSLVASLSLLLGACSSSSPPSPDNKVAKTQGQAEAKAGAEGAKALPAPKPLPKPKALPAPQAVGNSGAADARGGNASGGPGTNTAPPGPEILGGPDLANMSYKVSVEATFKGLPAGAYIVAPSARDRRYQKVTKSAHSGVPGAVTASEDGENLFFVSEPFCRRLLDRASVLPSHHFSGPSAFGATGLQ